MPARPVHELFGFLLADILRLSRADFAARAVELPLTEGQWRVLAYLARMEGCRPTDLAERLDMREISLTRHLDRLVEKGFVVRRPHPQDRRSLTLHLTAAAGPTISRLFELGLATRERALGGFDEGERRVLFDALRRIRTNLSTQDERATGTAGP
jgi:MarR family transcriptional regulator, transcriptional regulator for hemolysin